MNHHHRHLLSFFIRNHDWAGVRLIVACTLKGNR